jgi:D-sedoheptulose 7-phosphate isomerase
MAGTYCRCAKKYVEEFTTILRALDTDAIEAFADLLFDTWKENRQAFFFGNGGSASTASHHVLDLVKTGAVEGQRHLRAFGMNDNMGILTAVANDADYRQSFSFPLGVYSQPGDVAVAISCSGNSPNIVHACELARDRRLTVVALTGFKGGKIAEIADIHINVPSENYGIIEDLHLSVGHMVAQVLKCKVESFATLPVTAH